MENRIPMIPIPQPFAGLVALSDPAEKAPHFATAAVQPGGVPSDAIGRTVAILATPFSDRIVEQNPSEAPKPWHVLRDETFDQLRKLGIFLRAPRPDPTRHDRLLSMGNAVIAFATLTGTARAPMNTTCMARRLYSERLCDAFAEKVAREIRHSCIALFANVLTLAKPYGTTHIKDLFIPATVLRRIVADEKGQFIALG